MTPEIIAQGDRWLVVNKPSGMACHKSPLHRNVPTVADWLFETLHQKVHLVHRLDQPTSGCLLVARDSEMAATLQAQMVSPAARKTYLALARGFWRWTDPVFVDHPVKDDKGRRKEAQTTFEALLTCRHPRVSVLRVTPHTGRYHQIRRHGVKLNHPLLGDTTHGDNRENIRWRARGLTRLGLHCFQLDLPCLNLEGQPVTAPIPALLRQVIANLPGGVDVLQTVSVIDALEE